MVSRSTAATTDQRESHDGGELCSGEDAPDHRMRHGLSGEIPGRWGLPVPVDVDQVSHFPLGACI